MNQRKKKLVIVRNDFFLLWRRNCILYNLHNHVISFELFVFTTNEEIIL